MKNYILLDHIEPNKCNYLDTHIYYYGSLPKKGVFVSSKAKPKERILKAIYRCGLEIALNGYDGVYIPASTAALAFERGVFDGGGKLFQVLPFSFEYNRYISRALITNGGVITFKKDHDPFNIDNLNRAKVLASMLSNAVIIAEDDEKHKYPYQYIEETISIGKDIAILKDALVSPFARTLVKEGCPVIEMFSDFLISPKYITYRRDKGIYGFEGDIFDIIKIDE